MSGHPLIPRPKYFSSSSSRSHHANGASSSQNSDPSKYSLSKHESDVQKSIPVLVKEGESKDDRLRAAESILQWLNALERCEADLSGSVHAKSGTKLLEQTAIAVLQGYRWRGLIILRAKLDECMVAFATAVPEHMNSIVSTIIHRLEPIPTSTIMPGRKEPRKTPDEMKCATIRGLGKALLSLSHIQHFSLENCLQQFCNFFANAASPTVVLTCVEVLKTLAQSDHDIFTSFHEDVLDVALGWYISPAVPEDMFEESREQPLLTHSTKHQQSCIESLVASLGPHLISKQGYMAQLLEHFAEDLDVHFQKSLTKHLGKTGEPDPGEPIETENEKRLVMISMYNISHVFLTAAHDAAARNDAILDCSLWNIDINALLSKLLAPLCSIFDDIFPADFQSQLTACGIRCLRSYVLHANIPWLALAHSTIFSGLLVRIASDRGLLLPTAQKGIETPVQTLNLVAACYSVYGAKVPADVATVIFSGSSGLSREWCSRDVPSRLKDASKQCITSALSSKDVHTATLAYAFVTFNLRRHTCTVLECLQPIALDATDLVGIHALKPALPELLLSLFSGDASDRLPLESLTKSFLLWSSHLSCRKFYFSSCTALKTLIKANTATPTVAASSSATLSPWLRDIDDSMGASLTLTGPSGNYTIESFNVSAFLLKCLSEEFIQQQQHFCCSQNVGKLGKTVLMSIISILDALQVYLANEHIGVHVYSEFLALPVLADWRKTLIDVGPIAIFPTKCFSCISAYVTLARYLSESLRMTNEDEAMAVGLLQGLQLASSPACQGLIVDALTSYTGKWTALLKDNDNVSSSDKSTIHSRLVTHNHHAHIPTLGQISILPPGPYNFVRQYSPLVFSRLANIVLGLKSSPTFVKSSLAIADLPTKCLYGDNSESITDLLAKFCVVMKLKTPFGGAQDTLVKLETALADLNDPAPSSHGKDSLNEFRRSRLLLQWLDDLARFIGHAAEPAQLSIDHFDPPIAVFFKTNQSTCLEWFDRIRAAISTASLNAGLPSLALRWSEEGISMSENNVTVWFFNLIKALTVLGESAQLRGLKLVLKSVALQRLCDVASNYSVLRYETSAKLGIELCSLVDFNEGENEFFLEPSAFDWLLRVTLDSLATLSRWADISDFKTSLMTKHSNDDEVCDRVSAIFEFFGAKRLYSDKIDDASPEYSKDFLVNPCPWSLEKFVADLQLENEALWSKLSGSNSANSSLESLLLNLPPSHLAPTLSALLKFPRNCVLNSAIDQLQCEAVTRRMLLKPQSSTLPDGLEFSTLREINRVTDAVKHRDALLKSTSGDFSIECKFAASALRTCRKTGCFEYAWKTLLPVHDQCCSKASLPFIREKAKFLRARNSPSLLDDLLFSVENIVSPSSAHPTFSVDQRVFIAQSMLFVANVVDTKPHDFGCKLGGTVAYNHANLCGMLLQALPSVLTNKTCFSEAMDVESLLPHLTESQLFMGRCLALATEFSSSSFEPSTQAKSWFAFADWAYRLSAAPCNTHSTTLSPSYPVCVGAYFKFLGLSSPSHDPTERHVLATLRLLRLLTKFASELESMMRPGLEATPAWPWRTITPQLLSKLVHKEGYVTDAIIALLVRLAATHPDQIIFPAVVGNSTHSVVVKATSAAVASPSATKPSSSPRPDSPVVGGEAGDDVIEGGDNEDEMTPLTDSVTDCQSESPLSKCYAALVTALSIEHSEAVAQTTILSRELNRIAVLKHERAYSLISSQWSDVVSRFNQLHADVARIFDALDARKLSRSHALVMVRWHYFSRLRPVIFLLQQLHALTEDVQSANDEIFRSSFRDLLSQTINALVRPKHLKNVKAALLVMEDFHTELRRTVEQRSRRGGALNLHDLSPVLASMSDTQIALPGTQGCVTLAQTEESIQPLASKTRPKRLVFLGSDGKRRHFLLKGIEDLHLDQRIMQLQATVNLLLVNAKFPNQSTTSGDEWPTVSSLHPVPLRTRHYSVTPLGARSGLIEWVQTAEPLYGLYKRWLASQATSGDDATTSTVSKRPSELFYEKLRAHMEPDGFRLDDRKKWPESAVQSAFKDMCAASPSNLISREIWVSSVTSGEWLQKQRRFSASLAVGSIFGYVIGLGDRHLDNILFDVGRAELLHIDFNVCFEKGLSLRVPERVPCRLTRNLVAALGPVGLFGAWRDSAEMTLATLRKGSETFLTLLETFVDDPLVDWQQQAVVQLDTKADEVTSMLKLPGDRTKLDFETGSSLLLVAVAENTKDWNRLRKDLEHFLEGCQTSARRLVAAENAIPGVEREISVTRAVLEYASKNDVVESVHNAAERLDAWTVLDADIKCHRDEMLSLLSHANTRTESYATLTRCLSGELDTVSDIDRCLGDARAALSNLASVQFPMALQSFVAQQPDGVDTTFDACGRIQRHIIDAVDTLDKQLRGLDTFRTTALQHCFKFARFLQTCGLFSPSLGCSQTLSSLVDIATKFTTEGTPSSEITFDASAFANAGFTPGRPIDFCSPELVACFESDLTRTMQRISIVEATLSTSQPDAEAVRTELEVLRDGIADAESQRPMLIRDAASLLLSFVEEPCRGSPSQPLSCMRIGHDDPFELYGPSALSELVLSLVRTYRGALVSDLTLSSRCASSLAHMESVWVGLHHVNECVFDTAVSCFTSLVPNLISALRRLASHRVTRADTCGELVLEKLMCNLPRACNIAAAKLDLDVHGLMAEQATSEGSPLLSPGGSLDASRYREIVREKRWNDATVVFLQGLNASQEVSTLETPCHSVLAALKAIWDALVRVEERLHALSAATTSTDPLLPVALSVASLESTISDFESGKAILLAQLASSACKYVLGSHPRTSRHHPCSHSEIELSVMALGQGLYSSSSKLNVFVSEAIVSLAKCLLLADPENNSMQHIADHVSLQAALRVKPKTSLVRSTADAYQSLKGAKYRRLVADRLHVIASQQEHALSLLLWQTGGVHGFLLSLIDTFVKADTTFDRQISDIDTAIRQLETPVLQRIRWAAGTNPEVAPLLTVFQDITAVRSDAIDCVTRAASPLRQVASALLALKERLGGDDSPTADAALERSLVAKLNSFALTTERAKFVKPSSTELLILTRFPLPPSRSNEQSWLNNIRSACTERERLLGVKLDDLRVELDSSSRLLRKNVNKLDPLLKKLDKLLRACLAPSLRHLLKLEEEIGSKNEDAKVNLVSIRLKAILKTISTFRASRAGKISQSPVPPTTVIQQPAKRIIQQAPTIKILTPSSNNPVASAGDSMASVSPSLNEEETASQTIVNDSENNSLTAKLDNLVIADNGSSEPSVEKGMTPNELLEMTTSIRDFLTFFFDRVNLALCSDKIEVSEANRLLLADIHDVWSRYYESELRPKTGDAGMNAIDSAALSPKPNSHAMNVWMRVKEKLEFTDVSVQVTQLIRNSTSIESLAHMYEGWTSWV